MIGFPQNFSFDRKVTHTNETPNFLTDLRKCKKFWIAAYDPIWPKAQSIQKFIIMQERQQFSSIRAFSTNWNTDFNSEPFKGQFN